MEYPEEIKKNLVKYINSLNFETYTFKSREGSYGHSAGDTIENLLKNILIKGGYKAYFTIKFTKRFKFLNTFSLSAY